MSAKQRNSSHVSKNSNPPTASGGDTSDLDCDSEGIHVLNNNVSSKVVKESLTPYEQNAYYKKSRRTNSVDRVAEIHGKEKKERSQQPDRP